MLTAGSAGGLVRGVNLLVCLLLTGVSPTLSSTARDTGSTGRQSTHMYPVFQTAERKCTLPALDTTAPVVSDQKPSTILPSSPELETCSAAQSPALPLDHMNATCSAAYFLDTKDSCSRFDTPRERSSPVYSHMEKSSSSTPPDRTMSSHFSPSPGLKTRDPSAQHQDSSFNDFPTDPIALFVLQYFGLSGSFDCVPTLRKSPDNLVETACYIMRDIYCSQELFDRSPMCRLIIIVVCICVFLFVADVIFINYRRTPYRKRSVTSLATSSLASQGRNHFLCALMGGLLVLAPCLQMFREHSAKDGDSNSLTLLAAFVFIAITIIIIIVIIIAVMDGDDTKVSQNRKLKPDVSSTPFDEVNIEAVQQETERTARHGEAVEAEQIPLTFPEATATSGATSTATGATSTATGATSTASTAEAGPWPQEGKTHLQHQLEGLSLSRLRAVLDGLGIGEQALTGQPPPLCQEKRKRELARLCLQFGSTELLSAFLTLMPGDAPASPREPGMVESSNSTSRNTATVLAPFRASDPLNTSGILKSTESTPASRGLNSTREVVVVEPTLRPSHSNALGSRARNQTAMSDPSEHAIWRQETASDFDSRESVSSDTMVKTRVPVSCLNQITPTTHTSSPNAERVTSSCESPASSMWLKPFRKVLEYLHLTSFDQDITSSDGEMPAGEEKLTSIIISSERGHQQGSSHTDLKSLDKSVATDHDLRFGNRNPMQDDTWDKMVLRSPEMWDTGEMQERGADSECYDASDEESTGEDDQCLSSSSLFSPANGRSPRGGHSPWTKSIQNASVHFDWSSLLSVHNASSASASGASLLSVQNHSSLSALSVESPSENSSAVSSTENPSREKFVLLSVENPSTDPSSVQSTEISSVENLFVLSVENPSTENPSMSSAENICTENSSLLSVENPPIENPSMSSVDNLSTESSSLLSVENPSTEDPSV